MSAGAAGATAAAAAAAAAAEARRVEEEQMTGYDAEALAGHWQFKIVRGNFSTRERVEAACAEQAEHGWTLVEVFDAQRIRFKRPAAAAAKDVARDGNPYATTSKVGGLSPDAKGGLIAVGVMLAIGMLVLGAVLVRGQRQDQQVRAARQAEAARVIQFDRPGAPPRVIHVEQVPPAAPAHR